MVLTQRLQGKLKARLSNRRPNMRSERFLESFSLQPDKQIDVFKFVTEHLEDLKLFVSNKIAELGPLKVQLSVFVQMLKPTDDTKVDCHANTKSKTCTTEPSDDEKFEMIDLMNNSI